MEKNHIVTDKDKKIVRILLTRHYDIWSEMIYQVTGRKYTHASIGLGEDEECFYSFNFKGFRIEKPSKWKSNDKGIPSVLYQIEVTEETYHEIKNRIESIKSEQNKYRYSLVGIILCILRIPHHVENKYFCSQFVAELLVHSKALNLNKRTSLCLPNTLIAEFKGNPRIKRVLSFSI